MTRVANLGILRYQVGEQFSVSHKDPSANLGRLETNSRLALLVLANCQRENTVPHTIVTNTCEGVADCVDACPVACIHEGPGKNVKGTDWYWIDFATCIDCGICLQVCPVEGAIVPEERPDLQETP